jgi:hypothetical protein
MNILFRVKGIVMNTDDSGALADSWRDVGLTHGAD